MVFIRTALSTGEFNIDLLTNDVGTTALAGVQLIAYLLVPLVLLLLLGPFIMCFCCCDNKCPLSCCCRKDSYQGCCDKYTCPLLALLCALVMLSSCTAGMIFSFSLTDSAAQLECQLFTLTDAINGGIINSQDNKFFVGVGPAIDKITDLKNSVDGLITEVTSLGTSIDGVANHYTTYTTNMQNNFNAFTNPTYNSAFYNTDGTTSFAVTSEFKEIYFGPSTNESTLYGISNRFMSSVNSALSPILTEVKNGASFITTNAATINQTLNEGSSIMEDLKSSID